MPLKSKTIKMKWQCLVILLPGFVLVTGIILMTPRHSLPLPLDQPMGFAFDKYPSPESYHEHLQAVARRWPETFRFFSDRKSYSGDHDLIWVEAGDPNRPAIVVVSVLHGRHEWQGAHLVMHFIEQLLDPEGPQAAFCDVFLKRYRLVAVPIANPWGYFASPDGEHHNNHSAPVPGIESADWHDMTNYSRYSGVNLNRNFDINFDTYRGLPFSMQSFWNGSDYQGANYFMMPYYADRSGLELYDPQNLNAGHILKPDVGFYDYKGGHPFSEPETQLIRDLFQRYAVKGFIDWHIMNPWQRNNTSYTSLEVDRMGMIRSLEAGLDRVRRRHPARDSDIPMPKNIIIEEYDGSAPFSLNWAQNRMHVPSFGWETGTAFPEVVWTDAYMETFYRALRWIEEEN